MSDLFEEMKCLSCGKKFKDHTNTKLNLCVRIIELVLKYPKMFPYSTSEAGGQ